MIAPGANVRVYLACGVTDMRKGIDGLMTLVQSSFRHLDGYLIRLHVTDDDSS